MTRPDRPNPISSLPLQSAATAACPLATTSALPPWAPSSPGQSTSAMHDNCGVAPWEQLLRINQFVGIGRAIPISRSSWWKGVKEGRYPKPIKLGPRTTAWRLSDLLPLLQAGIGHDPLGLKACQTPSTPPGHRVGLDADWCVPGFDHKSATNQKEVT